MQSLRSLIQMLQALLADCEEARYWERQCKEEQKIQIDFSYGRNIPSPSSKASTTEIVLEGYQRLTGPALRISKLGSCLGPPSKRAPRILSMQTKILLVLSYVYTQSIQLNYILYLTFNINSYSNDHHLLNEHSFIIFILNTVFYVEC